MPAISPLRVAAVPRLIIPLLSPPLTICVSWANAEAVEAGTGRIAFASHEAEAEAAAAAAADGDDDGAVLGEEL
jgi:hypothetical protein